MNKLKMLLIAGLFATSFYTIPAHAYPHCGSVQNFCEMGGGYFSKQCVASPDPDFYYYTCYPQGSVTGYSDYCYY